jgi:sulfoxide reductase catalytic subunit YedY
MIIRGTKDIRPSEITPYDAYLNRRQLIGAGTALSLGSLLARAARADLSMDEKPTAPKYVTSYNNYYEFGTGKSDPVQNAHTLTIKPWSLKVDGLVARPADYALTQQRRKSGHSRTSHSDQIPDQLHHSK